ncbi:hypothetical protein DPMN_095352 [Dreissena polymorpha]|uniref:Uncharacterized protein n=1 Tax=Dreissena polymorpha TaxID=45954 RepID=A0A9D4L775_DREPO|nr:hypothetical protein DPMN_095352 [Dreissena polymorpha]
MITYITYNKNISETDGCSPMMRYVNLCVNNHLKNSIIILGDIDPSDLKPHQKEEVMQVTYVPNMKEIVKVLNVL